jgi:hypothetical protein
MPVGICRGRGLPWWGEAPERPKGSSRGNSRSRPMRALGLMTCQAVVRELRLGRLSLLTYAKEHQMPLSVWKILRSLGSLAPPMSVCRR